MIKVSILKNGQQAFGAPFNTREEADSWIEKQEAKGSWGNPEEYEVQIIDLEDIGYNRAERIKAMIKERDQILCATDWIFLPDVKFDQKHRKMYMTYRQLLRDVPQNITANSAITFETFEHWMRRKHPEEFMDGGKGQQIIYRFMYYVNKD